MMKETILENGIQYSLRGDYYLPDLELKPEPRPIGRLRTPLREITSTGQIEQRFR